MMVRILLPYLKIISLFSTETPQPVISLHPPWTTVFQGESVNLTCHGYHFYAPGETTWYLWDSEKKTELESKRNTVTVRVSGEYRCQVPGSKLSKPVTLLFSSDDLILQTPYSVFEADSVVLRCREKTEAAVRSVKLHRNEKFLANLKKGFEYHIKQASLKDNGSYRCIGIKNGHHLVSSKAVELQVQELFPDPVLTFSALKPIEGSPVILTCKTYLPPQRSDVQLQFNFQSDAQILWSGWRKSPEFHIISVWRKKPAAYWCEIQTQTISVRKKSQKSYMYTQRSVFPVFTLYTHGARVLAGDMVTLHCKTQRGSHPILYQFFHEDELIKEIEETSRKISSSSYSLRAEYSGSYYCTVKNDLEVQRSNIIQLCVTVPVSPPVLSLQIPRARAFEGDIVTLHCETQRGSHNINYKFYRMNVILEDRTIASGEGAFFSFHLTEAHSGSYYCTANNGFGSQHSEAVNLFVAVPVPRPVLTLRTPHAQAIVGDLVEFHCEAQKGSPPILYQFYHDDVSLGSSSAPLGGGVSFNLSLTTEHSGKYYCEADNGLGAQHSDRVSLNVKVPVSRPVLTLRTSRVQAVVGDMVELHCEVWSGSPPILYQFYHEHVSLGSNPAPAGEGASFNISLMAEHSGNFSCEADNGLGAQRSEVVTLSVTVPVSLPILTLRAPQAQTVVGDVVELHCEVRSGSFPITYRFYHEDVILKNSSVISEGGTSFNLSLTAEHSGNYSCQAINDVGDQLSKVVEIYITGLTENRSGSVTAGVTGGLLGMMGLAAVTLLLYHWIRKKAETPRNHSELNPQEPTYSNVPAYLELQPMYSNVNLSGGDVVYSEVKSIKETNKPTVASGLRSVKNEDSPVIYSEVKVTSTPASRIQPLASSDPHR
ncbi:Fc receptor-like protein 5 [Sorex fumeus]|uniref:Fc receptor-like protein 5 n=1 Tax=Sorex fumeus TaxID=62283 RepID=UPI0024ACA9E2|nr:Fc receptor-like protein 5 [Sorex fumeus]